MTFERYLLHLVAAWWEQISQGQLGGGGCGWRLENDNVH